MLAWKEESRIRLQAPYEEQHIEGKSNGNFSQDH